MSSAAPKGRKLQEEDIVKILVRGRHGDDLCVPQCKDGPSQGARHRRLDLWAMRRSYSRSCTFGYEVKISRTDFFGDQKWHEYLDLCNEFYFVTPWKLVAPEEVPANAGLIWVSQTGTVCHVKKKAEHRKIEAPLGLLTYVLMSRAVISARDLDADNRVGSPRDNLRRWVDEKREWKDLGHEVARTLRAHVAKLERETQTAKAERDSLIQIRDFWLKELGGKESELAANYAYGLQRRNEIMRDSMKQCVSDELLQDIRDIRVAISAVNHLPDKLKKLHDKLSGKES